MSAARSATKLPSASEVHAQQRERERERERVEVEVSEREREREREREIGDSIETNSINFWCGLNFGKFGGQHHHLN